MSATSQQIGSKLLDDLRKVSNINIDFLWIGLFYGCFEEDHSFRLVNTLICQNDVLYKFLMFFQTSLTNLELSIVLTLSTVINEGSELVWNCLTRLIYCQLYLLSMKDKGADDGSGQIRFIFENVRSRLGVYESEKKEPYRHWLTDPTCFDQPNLTEHNWTWSKTCLQSYTVKTA